MGVGFAFTHDAVSDIRDTATTDPETGWIGHVYYGEGQEAWIGNYIDSFLLLIFGGIPWQVGWSLSSQNVILESDHVFVPQQDSLTLKLLSVQVYFQRVLSSRTARTAQLLSFAAAFGCLFMAVPAVLIGAIAKSTNWNETDYARYYKVPIEAENYKLVLPLVMQYLCPTVVGVIGKFA